ncbi:MAG: hypothetical protein NTW49_01495 [Bacteroidia bacterium]|nr:hypothetical protein [Bacteroidia bacterium]
MTIALTKELLHPAGKVIKTNGKLRKIILGLDAGSAYLPKESSYLFVDVHGCLVPFFIEEISFKGDHSAAVLLRFLDSEKKSKEISGCLFYIDPTFQIKKKRKNDPSVDLLGYTVSDIVHGELGIVSDIIIYPGNPLLSIMKEDKEILVPLAEDFIVKIDRRKKYIEIQAPEGLIDLNK